MPKLTLSANQDVIAKAKQIAKEQGTSVSAMFSQFVCAASQQSQAHGRQLGPITRRAMGIAKLPSDKPYRELIEEAILEKHGK